MKQKYYKVTLTNGTYQYTYTICTFGEREAIILAQAEAIRAARGYELVSCEEVTED
jgi:hypothetical protein